jgi:enterochelin esterase-like enzyme
MKIKSFYLALLLCMPCLIVWGQEGGRICSLKMPCTLLQGVTERAFTIYLPPGYDADRGANYPVLYLLHGGGGANTDWARMGNLLVVADSLIKHGLAPKMIVACPEGNENNMIWFNAPHWKYEDYFFQEFIPYIETHYRALKGKMYRAVAGYSMGGGASVVYGVHHPELFFTVYGMSSYLRRQPLEFLKNDPSGPWRQQIVEDNNPIKSIAEGDDEKVTLWKTVNWYIDCGDDDFTFDANVDLARAFKARGIHYELRIKDGNHNWDYWRPALVEAIKCAFGK